MTDSNYYHEFSAVIDQCDKELDEIYHDYAVQHHLSDAALWILYAIYSAKETMTQANICSTWFFSRQTINTALKGLEQQGIIELVSIPTNKKSKQILFTQKGNEFASSILTPLLQAEYQVFTSFSEEEAKIFMALSQKRCQLLREFLTMK